MIKKKQIVPILLCGLFVIGILLRIVYLLQYNAYSPTFSIAVGPDVEEYIQWSKQIMSGEWIWTTLPNHGPLYAYFLFSIQLLSPGNIEWIRYFQMFWGLIPALLAFFITSKWATPYRLLFVAFLLFYPILIFHQGEIISENLVVPLFSLAIFCMLFSRFHQKKYKPFILTLCGGILTALAILAHGSVILPTFLILCWLFIVSFKSHHIKKLFLFIIPILIIIIPVALYNSHIANHFTLTQANSGFNLWLGNNSHATGTCYLRPGPQWDKIHLQAEKSAQKENITKDQWFIKETQNFILENPIQWGKLIFKKFLYAWHKTDLVAGADVLPIQQTTPFIKYTYWLIAIFQTLGLSGLFIWISCFFHHLYKRNFKINVLKNELNSVNGLCAIWVFSGWITQIIFVASGRYRLLIIVPVAFFAVFAIRSYIQLFKIKKNSLKTTVASMISLFVASFIVALPSSPINAVEEEGEYHSILAESWLSRQEIQQAQIHAQKAFEINPSWSRNACLLGQIYEKLNQPRQAYALYQMAWQQNHDLHAALNLGAMAETANQFENAEKWYRACLTASNSKLSSMAHYNLGILYLKQNLQSKALPLFKEAIQIDPTNEMALNSLAVIQFQNNNLHEAESLILKAIQLNPQKVEYQLNYILFMIKQKRFNEASQRLQYLKKINPNHPKIKNEIFELLPDSFN